MTTYVGAAGLATRYVGALGASRYAGVADRAAWDALSAPLISDISATGGVLELSVTATFAEAGLHFAFVYLESADPPTRTQIANTQNTAGGPAKGHSEIVAGSGQQTVTVSMEANDNHVHALAYRQGEDPETGTRLSTGRIIVEAADATPDAFSLGADQTGDPGEVFTFSDVVVSGIDAGVTIPAAVSNGEMRVLDDSLAEVSAWGVSDTVNVQLGYTVQTRGTAATTYDASFDLTLEIGDEGLGSVVSDSVTITTRNLILIQDGAFVEADSDGGDLQYDRDGDGTYDGEVTTVEQAALVGQPPYFDLAPFYTAAGEVLTIDIGFPVWDGTSPRYLVDVRTAGDVPLQTWDTNDGWAPTTPTVSYDASGDSGTLTVRWVASDSNGETIVTDTYEAGTAALPEGAAGDIDFIVHAVGAVPLPDGAAGNIDFIVNPIPAAIGAAGNIDFIVEAAA